jgi:hypothetical protein
MNRILEAVGYIRSREAGVSLLHREVANTAFSTYYKASIFRLLYNSRLLFSSVLVGSVTSLENAIPHCSAFPLNIAIVARHLHQFKSPHRV